MFSTLANSSGNVSRRFTPKILSLSQPIERTQKVFNAIKKATNNSSATPFKAGDIAQVLRDGGFPLGAWEVRGELTTLHKAELIALDAASADWQLTATGSETERVQ